MSKNSNEMLWEKKLNIDTASARHEKDDDNHSRYEPTPYTVLKRLSESGLISENDILVDYGSGKGRVSIFLSCACGGKSIGVEYDPRMHDFAMKNLLNYAGRREKVAFVLESAENYKVREENLFYFFNPFSVRILRSVIGRIKESYFENPRRMLLFFYYALDSYLTELMNEPFLTYEGEIDCRDLFHNEDEKEKILIFSVG